MARWIDAYGEYSAVSANYPFYIGGQWILLHLHREKYDHMLAEPNNQELRQTSYD